MAATAAKTPGKANLIVTVGALTVLAAVGGGLVGKMIVAKLHALPPPPAETETTKPSPYAGGDIVVQEMPPLVVNLADPPETRVRLQVSIVFSKKAVEAPSILVARINDDFVGFMKTLSIGQLQGASGLQALREDLNERAATRSDGKVREVVIETLVVQ